MASYSDLAFDPSRDITGLRGDFFPEARGPQPMNLSGLTDRQADYIAGRYEAEIAPLYEMEAKREAQRLQNKSRRLGLKTQQMAFQAAKEEARSNREMLTRLPALMQEVGGAVEMAKTDPETAASRILEIQMRNADVYSRNPAFQTTVTAAGRRVNDLANKHQAEVSYNRDQAARMLALDHPEAVEQGMALLERDGLVDDKDADVIKQANLLNQIKKEENQIKKEEKFKTTEATKASDYRTFQLETFEKEYDLLKGIKAVTPKDGDEVYSLGANGEVIAREGEADTTPTVGPDDRAILDGLAIKYKIRNPDPDPFRLRFQLIHEVNRMKGLLHNGGKTGSISSAMRKPPEP